jgi:hypothetical protein
MGRIITKEEAMIFSGGISRSTDQNCAELEVELVTETDAACLLSDGINEEWLPKSLLEDDMEHLGNGLVRVVFPEWIAEEKGFI